MKKFLSLLAILMMALTTTVITSCSSDDDDNVSADKTALVGTWVATVTENDISDAGTITFKQTLTYTFTAEGKFTYTVSSVTTGVIYNNNETSATGSYVYNSSKQLLSLNIASSTFGTGTGEFKAVLKDNTLTLTNDKAAYTFIKQ